MDRQGSFSLLGICYAGRALEFAGYWNQATFGQIFDKDLEIRVDILPTLVAPFTDPVDVHVPSLTVVFQDKETCCGENSAPGDRVRTADPRFFKRVASKLNGRHLLSDGRQFVVIADNMAPNAMNSDTLIGMITNHHAGLMHWNAHLLLSRVVQGFL